MENNNAISRIENFVDGKQSGITKSKTKIRPEQPALSKVLTRTRTQRRGILPGENIAYRTEEIIDQRYKPTSPSELFRPKTPYGLMNGEKVPLKLYTIERNRKKLIDWVTNKIKSGDDRVIRIIMRDLSSNRVTWELICKLMTENTKQVKEDYLNE